jgi:hypothetical protein
MDWDAVDARLDAEAQRKGLRTALCTLSEPDRELLLRDPPAPQPVHRPAERSPRSRRGIFIAASVAAATAVAAGTTIFALSDHSGGSQAAGGGAGSNAGINLAAAIVLRNAGKTPHRDIWISHHGNSVLEDDGVFGNMTPDNLGPDAFPVGATSLTWDQLYALPTDPAKLEPVLRSDIKGTTRTRSAGPGQRSSATAKPWSSTRTTGSSSPTSRATRPGECPAAAAASNVEFGAAYTYVTEGPAATAPAVP